MRTRPPTTRVSILYCQGSVDYKTKRAEKSAGCTGATTEKNLVVRLGDKEGTILFFPNSAPRVLFYSG